MKKLRVWWIPQVPMKAFLQRVNNLSEARLLLNALALYDIFQFENNIKPDYCNAGGLSELSEGGWWDWEDPDTGEGINEISEERLLELSVQKMDETES